MDIAGGRVPPFPHPVLEAGRSTIGIGSGEAGATDGTTSIGKGDVQTALGYHNDAAFQNDAKNITFSLAPDTVHYVATHYCSAQNVWQPGDPPMDIVQSDMGTIGTVSNTPNVQALTNGSGKVTGYLQTGVTPGAASALDYSKIDWSKWSTWPRWRALHGLDRPPGQPVQHRDRQGQLAPDGEQRRHDRGSARHPERLIHRQP